MRWAWRIGRVAGIEIRIHVTFLLLLIWIGTAEFLTSHRWETAAAGVAFILAIFGTVVLHELGHALTARHFGIRTFDITLLPIGGVARLERIPERPMQELLVALAGPAVNLVIGLGLLALLALLGARAGLGLSAVPYTPATFFGRLAWVNLSLALFNLLPAFPMDGGRAFRAILSTRMDYLRATHAAARLGQTMAFLFGVLGLFFNPILAFVGLFVWISAAEEASATQLRVGLEGVAVQQAMVTDFHTLAPEDPLSLPVSLVLHSFQRVFPVCSGTRLIGLLTHQGLLDALARDGEDATVLSAMEARFEWADPMESLAGAIPRLQAAAGRALPVVRAQEVVGLLTFESLGELMALQGVHRHRPV